MANTYLQRTFGSGNQQLWTWSGWVKRSKLGTDQQIFGRQIDGGNIGAIRFQSDDAIRVNNQISGTGVELYTTMKFRDTNGWYHLVVVFKGAESTASDRVDIYVNGEEIDFTVISSSTAGNGSINGSGDHFIGKRAPADNDRFLEAVLSHVHFIDGTAYDATAFGEYDANGVWKIKTSPSVTYGTNGFFILKDGNSVTDQSGEGNNFTVGGGTLTNTEDNPSNVFATLNPLHIQGTTSRSITYGNTRFYTTTTAWGSALSTLGFSSGKFYVEAKILTLNSSTGYGSIAIQDINAFGSSGNTNENLNGNNAAAGLGLDYRSGQSNIQSGASTVSSNVGDFSNNDIIGMAIDMDNKALYIHKNGIYYQIGGVTGVPTSGASKTGAITIPASVETCAIGLGSYTSNADFCYNFGNGYFLSTAVASAGTNASGNGIFEYDVPTGFTALSTKGLNL